MGKFLNKTYYIGYFDTDNGFGFKEDTDGLHTTTVTTDNAMRMAELR